MSGSIPQLKLYPLYPGGPIVSPNGAYSANSAYYTQANRFTASYGVNVSGNASRTNANYAVDGNRLVSRSASATSGTTSNWQLDGTAFGGLNKAPVSAVAPAVPNLYKQAEQLLSLTELNFSDLMNQSQFLIPSIGLKVTTDGAGGVDNVSISPSSRKLVGAPGATDTSFTLPNRSQISRDAIYSLPDLTVKGADAVPQPSPVSNGAKTDNNLLDLGNPTLASLNVGKLQRNAGIFNVENLEELALRALGDDSIDLDRITPALETLYQQQAGGGFQQNPFALGAIEAQQAAATQAKLGVNPGEKFQATVASLVQTSRQSDSFASIHTPRMDQVMNGRIAGAPWVQGQSSGNVNSGLGNAASFDMGAAVADAMSRKGKGSYIPFQMQSESGGQSFGGSNPFMGAGSSMTGGSAGGQDASQNMFRRPRQPLAFIA